MSSEPRLDDCGCCDDGSPPTPPANPPGLDAVAFRAGDYGAFLRRMFARLAATPSEPDQPGLTTHDLADPAVALLDAAAVVGDVLTFYDERLANEAYLRTATERRSVLELAREIGYEMKPGVAAAAYLAFEMAAADQAAPPVPGAPPAPLEAALAPGIQVMSVPQQGEQPQVFETVQGIRARPAWNALRPRRTRPQDIDIPALQADPTAPFTLYLQGSTLNIKPGAMILLAGKAADGSTVAFARPVHAVLVDDQAKTTRIDFTATPGPPPAQPPRPPRTRPVYGSRLNLSESSLSRVLLGTSTAAADLVSYFAVQRWDIDWAQAYIATATAPAPPPPEPELGVFILRGRTGFFGNNAPRQETLPLPANTRGDAYPQPWDGTNKRLIWTDSQGKAWSGTGESLGRDAYLDRSVPEVTKGGWAVFDDEEPGGAGIRPYLIADAGETSLADYGLSAKVSGLNVTNPDKSAVDTARAFRARFATAYVQSEKLTVAETPIPDPVKAGEVLELDGLDLHLTAGQAVALRGTRTDLDGVTWSEILFIADIVHTNGHTELALVDGLGNAGPQYSYQRASVQIKANVALATHGETVREVLGSGSGALTNQRFTLKRPPLTYISAAGGDGAASTLVVRVNNAAWTEVDSLFNAGPQDQVYIVRRDDAGTSTITFGDGEHGARLPTGIANVTAVYRTGIGSAGAVKAGALATLMTRPLGVRGATNPLDAGGAAEPETAGSARSAAPARVLTLDRVVSLRDFEDFARTFAGVGKAQATPLWRGEHAVVHLTVTSTTGSPLLGAPTLGNLRAAIEGRRDPGALLRVADYDPRPFVLAARLLADPRYEFDTVRQAALAALTAQFAFPQRELAQAVTAAEVIACLSGVTGVVAVDLDTLDYSVLDAAEPPAAVQPRPWLAARPARWDAATRAYLPAQLLYLDVPAVDLSEKT